MEMMTVVGILAIIGAMATPNAIGWMRSMQFGSAVRNIKMTLEDMRMHAIKNCADSTITFTDGSNAYQTDKWDRATQTDRSQTHQLDPGISANWNGGSGQLTFNSRGMASNGTITVRSNSGLCREIVVAIVGSSRIQGCP